MIIKYLSYLRYLKPFWKKELLILLFTFASVALALVNPYLTKLVIDKAYADRDLNLFIILVIAIGAILVLSGLLGSLTSYLKSYIRAHVNLNLDKEIFHKLQRFSYAFFQDSSTGENLYRIGFDTQRTAYFISDLPPQFLSLILKSIFIIAIIVYLDLKIAVFSLLLMPFLYIGPFYFMRKMKSMIKVWIEHSQGIFKKLQEVFSHMQLIKGFGKEGSETQNYLAAIAENTKLELANARVEATSAFVSSLANRLIFGLVIFYGGYQVIKGTMTLGSLSAIAIYLKQLSGLQESFSHMFYQFSHGLVSCGRLNEILEVKPESKEAAEGREVKFSKGAIQFENVSFEYGSKQNEMVLKDMGFCIEGGSSVALVGPSGIGKSTIINLILRLYIPVSGRIIIDGTNIGDVKTGSFYDQVGVVLQEPFLWNDTVENNIKYGKSDATAEEVKEAARIANIDQFVENLPQGYDTVIGENACKISEGQKQRVAIARAVVKKPKILILDEALSSVDVQVEKKIMDHIRDFLRGSTVIVISHRFSTIKAMDVVYFMDTSGKMEVGTHEELSNKSPRYVEYLSQQLIPA